MARVTLIIPCYNEAARLDVRRFAGFGLQGHALRLLFVDDGSSDATLAVLEQVRAAAPQAVGLLPLPQNRGKPEAVRHGFLHVLEAPAAEAPEYLGFWDADLATGLEELPAFCRELERRPEVDIVFGARVKLLGRTVERKAWRHYFGRVFATAVSVALSLGVYDTQCGAKLFRVNEALRTAFAEPFFSRWIFDVEILARYLGYYAPRGVSVADRVVELPLMAWRDVAGSKVGFSAGLRAFLDLARIHRTYVRPLRRAGRWPLHESRNGR
jgi:glycosyltransferase involved in cell wall biosynthesis